MMRFAFLLLLVINLGFAGYVYLESTKPKAEMPAEINRDAMKILSITDPVKASQEAQVTKKLAQSLMGAQCVNFAVKPVDAARTQAIFATLNLADRLAVSSTEEATRFAVVTAIQKDKKSAESVVVNLKKQGVNDVSVLPDNSISLGVFSTEEAAKHVLADVQTKGVHTAQISPRNVQPKETVFTVREPDVNLISRLAVMQRDIDGSNVTGATCVVPTPTPVSAVNAKK